MLGAIQSPGQPYHEQLRFLRTLEELQPDHIRIIKALNHDPGDVTRTSVLYGSIHGTLKRRLSDMPEDRLSELCGQLADEMRLVSGGSFKAMMTGASAEDLRNRFTPYGNRLVAYIRAAEQMTAGSA